MDRQQRFLSRGGANALNQATRLLARALDNAKISEKDRPHFVDWMVSSMWAQYKQENMNYRISIEDEILRLGIRFPNGTVRKDYLTTFRLPVDKMNNIQLEGVDELGLTFAFCDNGECSLSGIPERSGDYNLKLRFETAPGEPASEIKIPIAFNPDPRALWRDIPTPTDIPYYKEDSEAVFVNVAGETAKKDMVAASKRGRSHAQEGKARDDHFSLYHCDKSGWYIMAVADGAGSAKYSRKGSEVACRTVTEHCRGLLENNQEFEKAIRDYSLNRNDKERISVLTNWVHEIVMRGAKKAHDQINLASAACENSRPKDFATTLMFAICKKFDFGWFIASFWVGDGAMCVLDTKEQKATLLGVPDEGEFSGQTRFLTMPEIFRTRDVYNRLKMTIVPDFTALLLMSDGVSDPMFETERNLNDYNKWAGLYKRIQQGFPQDDISGVNLTDRNTEVSKRLLGWLDFWSPGNHDDRTIAILY